MDGSLTAALGVGFLLGVRHAMDADHVAAVSTLVSRHRSVARACLLGTFWGVGHTLALMVAAVLTIVFKTTISPAVERGLEMGVAAMLVLLGAHVLLRSLAGIHVHWHEHTHGEGAHTHLHVHVGSDVHRHRHALRDGSRPLLVGLVHGLAGSAALMLLALATIASPQAALLYVLVFGAGSTAGMLVLSGLIGLPFAVAAGRSSFAQRAVQALAGTGSLAFGLLMAWRLAGA
jgi:high-affinity nickel permease